MTSIRTPTIEPLPSATAAWPGTTSASAFARWPITARRSGSIQNWQTPTTAVAWSGGGIDIWRSRVVEREREHLPDLGGAHAERFCHRDELSSRRLTELAKQDDSQRGAVKIDVAVVDALGV